MFIFIRNIPLNSTLADLKAFIAPATKGGLFKRRIVVDKIDILIILHKPTNAVQWHGLLSIEDDKAGYRLIKLLNGKKLGNRPVMVREYHLRSWHNDQRTVPGQPWPQALERRTTERRRGQALEFIKYQPDAVAAGQWFKFFS